MADGILTLEWRLIPTFPKYEISDFGHVRCAKRKRILSPGKSGDGYWRIPLMRDGKRVTKYVSRLVAEVFVPNPFGKTEVNHKDGDKANNAASNLEWVTPSENVRHKMDVLGLGRGETAPHHKLTDEMVIFIRSSPKSHRELSMELGITEGHIGNVRRRLCWKHI